MLDRFRHLVLDCDGVVYVGDRPVSGTPLLAAAARERGMGVLFVTNDTTRSADDIAAHIRSVGIDAAPEEVLHAGRATAIYLAQQHVGKVVVLGTRAFADEIRRAGVDAVRSADGYETDRSGVRAVACGNDPDLHACAFDVVLATWSPGMPIVAGNGDRTYPGVHGPRIGCGSLAHAIAYATGADVTVVGKPSPVMFREAGELLGPGRVVMVGDSLLSDIAGANTAGWTSVWLRRPGTRPDGDAVPDLVIGDPRQLLR